MFRKVECIYIYIYIKSEYIENIQVEYCSILNNMFVQYLCADDTTQYIWINK